MIRRLLARRDAGARLTELLPGGRMRQHYRSVALWYNVGGDLRAPDDPAVVRRIADKALHRLAATETDKTRLGIVEREIRRREAWAAPAGKAFWISVTALAVSLIAAIGSWLR